MTYNSRILRDVLQARSLTRAQLSKRLGMKQENLEGELQREPEPTQGILRAIARDLAIPSFVFFMKEAPALHDVLADFRSATPGPTEKSRETIEAIQLAEGIQRSVVELKAPRAAKLPIFSTDTIDDVAKFALEAREFFGITLADQSEAKDAKAFYNICRKKIEDKGIFVLQDSFPASDGSGFCLSHPTHPIIVVNTKQQTRGRRLFTLIHELAHVLRGATGISDPFVNANKTERLCNRFASSFLVPKSYVEALLRGKISNEPDTDEVAWAARRFKISQEASVLLLEQLGLVKVGTHGKWKAQFHNSGNPDFSEKGGGAGGPPPQEKVKLAKYGFRLATAFDELMSKGRLNEIAAFRLTGLKPKYQQPYFEYANSLTSRELQTLDLDDE